MADVRRVGVLGCGLMGSGIAEIAAKAGLETWVREISEEFLEKGRKAITKSLDKAVEKGKLDAGARDAALANLNFTTELAHLENCDIIIEAVTEDLALKNEMFETLDAVCPKHTIFASNTSSLTIADMAAATSRPDRVLGLHFFNPVPVMKLVEVVRTIATSDDAYQTAFAFAKKIGKEPVEAKDTSGFIVNRLLVPYMLDAIRCLEQGLASIEDMDKSMQLGTGYPMGPFVLSDFVGIDTLYRISEIMFEEFRESRFAPPPLLKRMVTMGYYGRKSKKGFYDYTRETPVAMNLGI